MFRVMGLINLNENPRHLQELTSIRPLAGVPFGGKYRVIDFVLSNMVNSGIYNVGILMPEESSTLINHLRAGKEWDLDRKRDGLFLLTPIAGVRTPLMGTGDIDYFSQHLDYLMDSQREYVVVSTSQIVCNIDYRPVVEYHKQQGADVTLIFRTMDRAETRQPGSVMLTLDKNNWVKDMEIDPPVSESRDMHMRMCVIKRQLLIDIITHAMSRGGGDFIREVQRNVGTLKVNGWKFNGFAANMATINDYYRYSMDLLRPDIWENLFFSNGHVHTKVNDSAPTKYMAGADVRNCLLANNCRINGKVENSLLFRSVYIDSGAQVKDSIIMQDTRIGANAHLEYVISDKDVVITAGRVLKGDPSYPLVIRKGTVI